MSAGLFTHLKGSDLAARLSQPSQICHALDDLKAMHDEDGHWLTTTAAVIYCAAQTKRPDIEWHSILMENRRSQSGLESVVATGKRIRGNANRLGKIFCLRVNRKAYYRQSDLDEWLAQLHKSMRLQ
ncbi:hypothetical protein V6U78_07270 [Marinospirillum sp. MEB164]|uniref:Uncharacterized protein n=1 Tax=Marinospirillum alkalitolerans TaxID=3123374 RepID=A0ABW8PX65_9GAMM